MPTKKSPRKRKPDAQSSPATPPELYPGLKPVTISTTITSKITFTINHQKIGRRKVAFLNVILSQPVPEGYGYDPQPDSLTPYDPDFMPVSVTRIDLAEFEDEEGVRLFADELLHRLRYKLAPDLTERAMFVAWGAATHFSMVEAGLLPKHDLEKHLQTDFTRFTDLLRDWKRWLRRDGPAREPGRPALWQHDELLAALGEALWRLQSSHGRTLANIHDQLRRLYPDKAPTTPAALGRLLRRQGIDWKKFKKFHNSLPNFGLIFSAQSTKQT